MKVLIGVCQLAEAQTGAELRGAARKWRLQFESRLVQLVSEAMADKGRGHAVSCDKGVQAPVSHNA